MRFFNLRRVTSELIEALVINSVDQHPKTIKGFYEVIESLMCILVYRYDYSIEDKAIDLTCELGMPAITAKISIGYYADKEKAEWLDCKIWLSDEGYDWEIK